MMLGRVSPFLDLPVHAEQPIQQPRPRLVGCPGDQPELLRGVSVAVRCLVSELVERVAAVMRDFVGAFVHDPDGIGRSLRRLNRSKTPNAPNPNGDMLCTGQGARRSGMLPAILKSLLVTEVRAPRPESPLARGT